MKCHNTLLGGSCALGGFKCGIFYCKKSSGPEEKQIVANASEYDKRRLRANRDALRLLALRPRLLRRIGKKVNSVFSVLASLTFAAVFSLILQNSYVYDVDAASLTLTIPATPLSLNLTPSVESNFAKSTAGQVSVITDNVTGYTLSVKSGGEEDSADIGAKLKNEVNSSFINSISESTTEDNFRTDPKFKNSWGYLPSKFSSSSNSNFLPAPTTNLSIIEKTESANPDTPNNYDFTVAAKVDQSIPAGDYKDTFVFTSVANEIPALPMQNWDGCDALGEHETVRLRDTRDNTIYTVSKLKDGRCWMVENLRIVDKTITSEDSDVSESFTIPTATEPSTFHTDYSNVNNNKVYVDSDGGLYTWYTATAGTGNSSLTSDGQKASGSICPKGWKLPTGYYDNSEYKSLSDAYGGNNSTGSTNLRATPVPGFTYAGYIYSGNGDFAEQGSAGYYWSSTVYSSTDAYNLHLNSYYANPERSYYRTFGYSVRCLAQPTKTMQTVDEWGDSVKEHQVVSAVDERDGTTYRVSKLKSGGLWMVDNLRIADKTITSEDSDVSNNFTIPAVTDLYAFWVRDTNNVTNNAAYVDSYGGMYTWYTATAGSGNASTTTQNQNVPNSICPKGWKLPTSGSDESSSDFGKLVTAYGGNNSTGNNNLRATPVPIFTQGGYIVFDGRLSDKGSRGEYWSSTVYEFARPYSFHLYYYSEADPSYEFYGVYGASVRCVAREYKSMQKIDEWKDEVTEGQVVEAKDERDGNIYKVSKLKDGKIWMVENLKLGGDSQITLTSTNSDVSSDFTLPASTNSFSVYTDNNPIQINDSYADQYGVYYSWYAATAGTGTYSMSSGNATSSVCPKGWKLPTGYSGGDFENMVKKYDSGADSATSTALRATPAPGFLISGSYIGNSDYALDRNGFYWSSTAFSNNSAYNLAFSTLGPYYVNPTNDLSKEYGLSVRCIAR